MLVTVVTENLCQRNKIHLSLFRVILFNICFLSLQENMGQAPKPRMANGGSKGANGNYWSAKTKQKKPKKAKEEQIAAKGSSLGYVLIGLLVALVAVAAGT